MSVQADRRTTDQLDLHRTIRLLACAFEVRTDSRAVIDRLDFLDVGARQPGEVTIRHRYDVNTEDDGFTIHEEGGETSRAATPRAVLRHFHDRFYRLAVDQFTDEIAIHAGTGVVSGRRFIVVGAKYAGKSTLMTRLLLKDVKVEGDETVIMSNGTVTAFPRRLHVRERSLPYLPELARLAPKLPWLKDMDGRTVYALDPELLGGKWTIENGPLDTIFFLDGSHSEETHLEECRKIDMCRLILAECLSITISGWPLIQRVNDMVRRANCYVIRNGDPAISADKIIACLTPR